MQNCLHFGTSLQANATFTSRGEPADEIAFEDDIAEENSADAKEVLSEGRNKHDYIEMQGHVSLTTEGIMEWTLAAGCTDCQTECSCGVRNNHGILFVVHTSKVPQTLIQTWKSCLCP